MGTRRSELRGPGACCVHDSRTLTRRLRAVGSPMFIASGVERDVAQCKAGIVPSLRSRAWSASPARWQDRLQPRRAAIGLCLSVGAHSGVLPPAVPSPGGLRAFRLGLRGPKAVAELRPRRESRTCGRRGLSASVLGLRCGSPLRMPVGCALAAAMNQASITAQKGDLKAALA